MSKSKHTAGTWTIETHGNHGCFVLYAGRTDMQHGMNLLTITYPDWNWEANKALIESAPDLLEACKFVCDTISWCETIGSVEAFGSRDAALADRAQELFDRCSAALKNCL